MAIPYEKIVKEDISLGYGTTTVTMPAGGNATGNKIGIHTLLGDFVNVKDFGAVGDGVTDDTAAIQAAINVLTNGGEVFFPRGTYKTLATIRVTVSSVGLRGCGRGSIIKPSSAVTGDVIAFGTTATEPLYQYITGFMIDLTSAGPAAIGINKISSRLWRLSHVEVEGNHDQGTQIALRLENGAHNRVADFSQNWCNTGILLDTSAGVKAYGTPNCNSSSFIHPWSSATGTGATDYKGTGGVFMGANGMAGVVWLLPYCEGNGIGIHTTDGARWTIINPAFDGVATKIRYDTPSRLLVLSGNAFDTLAELDTFAGFGQATSIGRGVAQFYGSLRVQEKVEEQDADLIQVRDVNNNSKVKCLIGSQARVQFGTGGDLMTLSRVLRKTASWSPGLIASGQSAFLDFTVSGSDLGNPAFAGYTGLENNAWLISAYVTNSASNVRVTILNLTGVSLTPTGIVDVIVLQST